MSHPICGIQCIYLKECSSFISTDVTKKIICVYIIYTARNYLQGKNRKPFILSEYYTSNK